MNEIEINDIRIIADFKSITFSEYKKTSVNKEDTILITGSFFIIHDFFRFFSSNHLLK